MKKTPEMIIFDYGHTLLYEPGFDSLRGTRAVLEHAASNPKGYTAQQVNEFWTGLYERAGDARKHDLEMHHIIQQRFAYEYLEIELSLKHSEIESLFWDTAAPGSPMPHTVEMLEYLGKNGIRSGVISNIGFSGEALAMRIGRLLPRHEFEFIIASSEYMFRKPDPMIFKLALRKAGLQPREVWYCGDTVRFDANGAHAAGLFPVWYDSGSDREYYNVVEEAPEYPHLHIRDWTELIEHLDSLR